MTSFGGRLSRHRLIVRNNRVSFWLAQNWTRDSWLPPGTISHVATFHVQAQPQL
jgi:hypothetical protein